MGDLTQPTVEHQTAPLNGESAPKFRPFTVFCFVVATLGIAELIYAVTRSFVWDEGFHLIAAKLINAGKTPYIDFCFPQTLFNAYWNAFWMHLFGNYWRVPHVPASLMSTACVFLTGHYVFTRLPVPRWRLAGGVTAACLLGLSIIFVEFAPIAQAYGMCTLFAFAAFRAAVVAVRTGTPYWAACAGLCAGISAGATLLSAPIWPVLFLWFIWANRAGNRWAKVTAFCAATTIPLLPEVILFVRAPRQTIFNVIQYQAIFRRADWKDAGVHDVGVFSAWLISDQALLLGLLSIAAIVFLIKRKDWLRQERAEFYLCAALAAALMAYLSTCHPTFTRYYVVAIPFVAVLAAVGLYFISAQMGNPDRPFWPAVALIAVMFLGVAKELFDDRDSMKWKNYEEIAKKVNEVTPRDGTLFADEPTFFIANRTPPSGLEFSYSHKVEIPPKDAALFHIIPWSVLDKNLKSGKYQTLETCDDDKIDKLGLTDVYAQKAEFGDCTVLWKFKGAPVKDK